MKKLPSLDSIKKRQETKLGKLGLCGPFVAGSLNRVEKQDKQGRTAVYHLLTFKEEGKTRSVYVPKALVGEVRGWVRNYRTLKKSIAGISADSIAVIRGHVPEKRAASEKSPKKEKGARWPSSYANASPAFGNASTRWKTRATRTGSSMASGTCCAWQP